MIEYYFFFNTNVCFNNKNNRSYVDKKKRKDLKLFENATKRNKKKKQKIIDIFVYLTDTSGVDVFFFQHINKTNEKLPVNLKDAHLM